MAATFTTDDKVSVERLAGTTDPDYGTPIESWVSVAANVWANVQDELPSRAEGTENGLQLAVKRTRLRLRNNSAITPSMRVILHGRFGDRVMQIVAGPALLDDRDFSEYHLEGFSS